MGFFYRITKCLFCYPHKKSYKRQLSHTYIDKEMMKLVPSNCDEYEQYADDLKYHKN